MYPDGYGYYGYHLVLMLDGRLRYGSTEMTILFIGPTQRAANTLQEQFGNPPGSKAVGAGGVVAGIRADAIIMDDLVDPRHAKSETTEAMTKKWLDAFIICRLMPGAKIWVAKDGEPRSDAERGMNL